MILDVYGLRTPSVEVVGLTVADLLIIEVDESKKYCVCIVFWNVCAALCYQGLHYHGSVLCESYTIRVNFHSTEHTTKVYDTLVRI